MVTVSFSFNEPPNLDQMNDKPQIGSSSSGGRTLNSSMEGKTASTLQESQSEQVTSFFIFTLLT